MCAPPLLEEIVKVFSFSNFEIFPKTKRTNHPVFIYASSKVNLEFVCSIFNLDYTICKEAHVATIACFMPSKCKMGEKENLNYREAFLLKGLST